MKKKSSKKHLNKKLSKLRSMISAAHVLIAVVAIIECLILVSFTTFSWIETASSLIIKTGHKHYEDTVDSRIPIANAYNYKFIVNSSTPSDTDVADLNNYFSYSGESETQNLYRFTRASSVDGKTFYFPKTVAASGSYASSYRKGDIIDSNANFTHFDFTVSNKGAASSHKLKFYFADANVFSVTNGEGSNLSATQLKDIKRAMRISFQSGSGTPKIYCMGQSDADESATSTDHSYTMTGVNTTSGGTANYTAYKIRSYNNQKLFTLGKNADQNISVRIWLDERGTGINNLTGSQLAGANININLKLTYEENDYDYLYFDDYTFSSGKLNKNNIGGHLTADQSETDYYRMYFAYSTNGTSYTYYPMTIDNSGPNVDANCWVTCTADGTPASTVPDTTANPYIGNLTTAGNACLTYSYFAWGPYTRANVGSTTNPGAPVYKWKLNGVEASSAGELRYNGYSAPCDAGDSTNCSDAFGGWAYTTDHPALVYFRDMATCNVGNSAFNAGSNYKYITTAVNAGSDTSTGNRSDVMYINLSSATDKNKTAFMYYDKAADNGNGLFKSYVPCEWLTTGNYLKFYYCPNGVYNASSSGIVWNNQTIYDGSNHTVNKVATTSTGNYIYTGLGYYENATVTNTSNRHGTGTWLQIESEPVYFTTELIDGVSTGAQRYQIGVKFDGISNPQYYTLIPDATHTRFYAYLPKAGTNASPQSEYTTQDSIRFRRFAAYNTSSSSADAIWYTKSPKGSRTYYPVSIGTSSGVYTRGYWNISVIVDGTYEHFFWVPETIVAGNTIPAHVLGTFQYNTTGHVGTPTYTDVTAYKLDEYRWYVPLDDLATIPASVYYRWIPYDPDGSYASSSTLNGDETVFNYSHYIPDGIYCVITEAADNTPSNAFD